MANLRNGVVLTIKAKELKNMENYWTIETPVINYEPAHYDVGNFNYALLDQVDVPYTVAEPCEGYEVN